MPTKKPTAGERIADTTNTQLAREATRRCNPNCTTEVRVFEPEMMRLARRIDRAIARAVKADRKARGGVETSARSLVKELSRKGRK